MPLIRIEVRDFKSYRGHQTIGPFRNVKSAQLRSSQLKDLVYRGRRLARGGVDGQDASYLSQSGPNDDSDKKEWRFQRTISTTGTSEYKLNNKLVPYSAYNAALQSHNILVKAKNFLVFQGDVEAVASQSSKELTRLIKQISGSLELAGEYEKAKEAEDRATENATFNFTKRRGIASEIKQYKEEKSEADRFEEIFHQDQLVLHRILWRLYHIEEGLEHHAREISSQSKALMGFREEQQVHDKELEAARAAQAKSRSSVMKAEKKIKKAEKALEDKKPDLVAIEGQIAHSARKLRNAQGIKEQVGKEEQKQEERLAQLMKELADVRKLADAAQGANSSITSEDILTRTFQEAQRQASENNFLLSEENLEEYHQLKVQASVLAVDERQALGTLGRELKTLSRTLAPIKDKHEQLEIKKSKLTDENQTQSEKRAGLEERISTLQGELTGTREAEAIIASLQEELQESNKALEEKTKLVDQVKKTASKASKVLEHALKEIASHNDEIEKLGLERSGIYRKCRLENVGLPLQQGNLKNVAMEESLRDGVAMDIDEEEGGSEQPKRVPDYGLEVGFHMLDDDEREIERMAPNLKAVDRLADVESKLVETEKEAEKSRKESKNARDQFNDVKKRRCDLFNRAYNHISERIDQVYKDLTKGKAAPMGGVAYLSLEDSEEPYVGGVKYHAMPPMKRFRDMEQLSGGEKTVAALALLFAIHSYQPSPFFVLDEVDAALDNTNVAKVANYIRSHASDTFQFIVSSLKGSLYERGHSLVGIYRDQDVNSSCTLTLDLTQYDD
ncbi:RecF/RecN/SMC protein [Heliocybe sulcata]|uniref:RecF/RecN/SMC protein n=1 Tax=Heliocybe sulcata TaxID=5364 RepID=A0A5C3MNB3_9AGAM|nr:RecF/RecN/SMC protein [Heliocybe sulcata]